MGNCVCYYQQTRPWYFNLFTKSASCSLLKETHFLCLYFSFSSWKFASSIIKRQKIETGICFLSLTFRSAFFWFLLLIFPFFSKRSIIPVVLFSTNPWSGYHWYNCRSVYQLAWENSRHWSRDATTTQSFPAKWRPRNKFSTFHIDDGSVTTQIKQVLLVGWKLKITFNQSETCTTKWWRREMSAVFSGYVSTSIRFWRSAWGWRKRNRKSLVYIVSGFLLVWSTGAEWFLFCGVKRWPYDKWTHLGIKSCSPRSSDLRVSDQYDFESYPELSAELIIWAIE